MSLELSSLPARAQHNKHRHHLGGGGVGGLRGHRPPHFSSVIILLLLSTTNVSSYYDNYHEIQVYKIIQIMFGIKSIKITRSKCTNSCSEGIRMDIWVCKYLQLPKF